MNNADHDTPEFCGEEPPRRCARHRRSRRIASRDRPMPPVERYLAERQQRRQRAELLRQEFDSRAADVAELLFEGAVGPGWLPLVRDLHGVLVGLEPDYRLLQVGAEHGALVYRAQFSSPLARGCRAAVAYACADASVTCELCGEEGAPRTERSQAVTLCGACFAADRACARERGEYAAALRLQRLLSGDPDYPSLELLLLRRPEPPT